MKPIHKIISSSLAVLILIVSVVWITKTCDGRQRVTEFERVDSLEYYRNKVRILNEQLHEKEKNQTGLDSLYRVRPTDAELDSLGARIRADVRKSFTR